MLNDVIMTHYFIFMTQRTLLGILYVYVVSRGLNEKSKLVKFTVRYGRPPLCGLSIDTLQFLYRMECHRVSVFTYICLFLQEIDTLLNTNFGELETVMGSVLQSKYVIRGFLSSLLGFSLLKFPVLVVWDPVNIGFLVRLAHTIDHLLLAALGKKGKGFLVNTL